MLFVTLASFVVGIAAGWLAFRRYGAKVEKVKSELGS
jgi:hypothetical protein